MTLILGAPRANHVLRLKDLVCCTPEGFQEFEKPDDPIAKARREDQQFDPNECKSQISRPLQIDQAEHRCPRWPVEARRPERPRTRRRRACRPP